MATRERINIDVLEFALVKLEGILICAIEPQTTEIAVMSDMRADFRLRLLKSVTFLFSYFSLYTAACTSLCSKFSMDVQHLPYKERHFLYFFISLQ